MSQSTTLTGLPCPRCRVDLAMTERVGVEIDYCPQCRGVWLDRGELDKIIERLEGQFSPPSQVPTAAPPPPQSPWGQSAAPDQGWTRHGGGQGHGHHDGRHGYGHGKRRSWLKELFD
jgi:Zn-finger nucleic acid-binding protein